MYNPKILSKYVAKQVIYRELTQQQNPQPKSSHVLSSN